MDSVFVMTQNPPQNLSQKEMILTRPTFLEEVKTCAHKRGGAATIGPNYLRAIAEEIGRRYDRLFNAYRNVVPHDFAGRICESDEDVAKTVHEMFQARYPVIYQRYYETVLRSRPFTTKVIYFSGSQEDAVVFQKLGIREISLKEVSDHLGEPRKIDAKPQPKPEIKIPHKVVVAPQPEPKIEMVNQLKPSAQPISSNSETLEELAALTEPVVVESVSSKELKPEQPETSVQQIKQTHRHQHKNQNRQQSVPPQPIKTSDV
jgi:hypothetical protein